jgi:hypothetical protein
MDPSLEYFDVSSIPRSNSFSNLGLEPLDANLSPDEFLQRELGLMEGRLSNMDAILPRPNLLPRPIMSRSHESLHSVPNSDTLLRRPSQISYTSHQSVDMLPRPSQSQITDIPSQSQSADTLPLPSQSADMRPSQSQSADTLPLPSQSADMRPSQSAETFPSNSENMVPRQSQYEYDKCGGDMSRYDSFHTSSDEGLKRYDQETKRYNQESEMNSHRTSHGEDGTVERGAGHGAQYSITNTFNLRSQEAQNGLNHLSALIHERLTHE